MLYKIALTLIERFTPEAIRRMYDAGIDAQRLLTNPEEVLAQEVESVRVPLVKQIRECRNRALDLARREMAYCQKEGIRIVCMGDKDYPYRLTGCVDSPSVLYLRGQVDLNAACVLAVVGTRRATDYGRMVTERLLSDLGRRIPNLLVVSGLAYGIDIAAHRTALQRHLPTVGVVAHGQDTLYPASHQPEARAMQENGGVLTEYVSGTVSHAGNFLRRNRIIAGLADATLVVESAVRGGALATARLADNYGRAVFAVPGRITDAASEGCNHLIFRHRATSISSADDIIAAMEWQRFTNEVPSSTEPDLFAQTEDVECMPPERRKVMESLRSADGMTLFDLQKTTGFPPYILNRVLVEMEINGEVRKMPSGMFYWIY